MSDILTQEEYDEFIRLSEKVTKIVNETAQQFNNSLKEKLKERTFDYAQFIPVWSPYRYHVGQAAIIYPQDPEEEIRDPYVVLKEWFVGTEEERNEQLEIGVKNSLDKIEEIISRWENEKLHKEKSEYERLKRKFETPIKEIE